MASRPAAAAWRRRPHRGCTYSRGPPPFPAGSAGPTSAQRCKRWRKN